MAQSDVETPTPGMVTPAPRVDMWLNLALAGLLLAIVAGAVLFAYTVQRDRQLEEASSATGRIVAALTEQVKRSPNDAVLRVRLGEGLGAMGKYQQAIDQLNAALKIDPKHTGAYLDLGMIAKLANDKAAAEGYFKKVVTLTEGQKYAALSGVREQALFNLGRLAIDDKRWAEGAGYFKGALQIRSDSSDTYYWLAKAYQGLGDTDSAIKQLEIGLQFDPGFAEAHYFLGQLFQQKKDDVNASYQYAQASKLAPGAEPPAQALDAYGTSGDWVSKAKAALAAGDTEVALTDVLVARNLDEKSVEAAAFHGRVLVERGDLKDALEVYRAAVKLDPANAEIKAQVATLAKQVKGLTPAKSAEIKRAAARKAASRRAASSSTTSPVSPGR
jgi:tetratricopeptide (TPR) repeat protein